MGHYDRYTLSQLLVLFSFFSLVIVAVYWINRAVSLFDRLIADGQNLNVFFEFTLLSLPQVILLVLPVSAFVASLYVLNRMITDSELVVLQTAGLGPLRLLRPVAIFGLFVGLLVAILANVLVPVARAQLAERGQEIQQDMAGRLLRDGEFIHPAAGVTVYFRHITDLGEFRDIFLQDRREAGSETTYTARRALLVRSGTGPRLVMFEGVAQNLSATGQRLSIVEFDDFTYDIGALIREGGARRYSVRELSTTDLLGADAAQAGILGHDLAELRFEGYDRLAKPFFALFVPLIGAATLMLGAFSRFGLWPQNLLAVALVIPLQALWNAAESVGPRDLALAKLALVQPVAAAAITAMVLFLATRNRRRGRQRRQAAAA